MAGGYHRYQMLFKNGPVLSLSDPKLLLSRESHTQKDKFLIVTIYDLNLLLVLRIRRVSLNDCFVTKMTHSNNLKIAK